MPGSRRTRRPSSNRPASQPPASAGSGPPSSSPGSTPGAPSGAASPGTSRPAAGRVSGGAPATSAGDRGAANRRARRTAERDRHRLDRAGSSGKKATSRPSTLTLATVGGLAAAVVLIVILFIANRPPAPLISVLHPAATTPPSLEHGRTLGSSDAPVKMDVWSDFQCPFCGQFWTTVEPRLVSTYVAPGDVQLIYHDYTFLGQESVDAAIAARCADQQGKFWEFHDYLYANQGTENSGAFAPARLTQFAEAIGLNMTAWSACLQDPTIAQANQAEPTQGKASGISGTPTILVAGVKVASYDYASISAAIDAALAKAGVTPPPGSTGAASSASPGSAAASSPASSPAATP